MRAAVAVRLYKLSPCFYDDDAAPYSRVNTSQTAVRTRHTSLVSKLAREPTLTLWTLCPRYLGFRLIIDYPEHAGVVRLAPPANRCRRSPWPPLSCFEDSATAATELRKYFCGGKREFLGNNYLLFSHSRWSGSMSSKKVPN